MKTYPLPRTSVWLRVLRSQIKLLSKSASMLSAVYMDICTQVRRLSTKVEFNLSYDHTCLWPRVSAVEKCEKPNITHTVFVLITFELDPGDSLHASPHVIIRFPAFIVSAFLKVSNKSADFICTAASGATWSKWCLLLSHRFANHRSFCTEVIQFKLLVFNDYTKNLT